MYWDADKSTYLPAPTGDNPQASSQDEFEKKEGKEKKDKEKVKMAKKIAKVLWKWCFLTLRYVHKALAQISNFNQGRGL